MDYIFSHSRTLKRPVLQTGQNLGCLILSGALLAISLADAVHAAPADSDRDGLPDAVETRLGTEPFLSDTDGDGLTDSEEVGSDLQNPVDSDADGKIDALDIDDDNDGVPTIVEIRFKGSEKSLTDQFTDRDQDGLKNHHDSDSDNDGLGDGQEAGMSGVDADHDRIDNAFDADFLASADDNGDGIADSISLPDANGDGIPDFLDANLTLAGDKPSTLEKPARETRDEKSKRSGAEAAETIKNLSLGATTKAVKENKRTETKVSSDQASQSGQSTTRKAVNPGAPVITPENAAKVSEKSKPVSSVTGQKKNEPEVKVSFEFNDIRNALDSDHDGLVDQFELKLGTDPKKRDSDGDGVSDAIEIGLDPNAPQDSDHDQLIDALDSDDDNDGVLTRHEDLNKDGSPINDDTDRDGVPNYLDANDDGDHRLTIEENQLTDSDGDGIVDYLDKNDGVRDSNNPVAKTKSFPDKPEIVVLYESNEAMLSHPGALPAEDSVKQGQSDQQIKKTKLQQLKSKPKTDKVDIERVEVKKLPVKTDIHDNETASDELEAPVDKLLPKGAVASKSSTGGDRVLHSLEKAISEHREQSRVHRSANLSARVEEEDADNGTDSNRVIHKATARQPLLQDRHTEKKQVEEPSGGFMAWLTSLWQD